MGTFQAAWEDEENNRRVDLVVDYQVAAGQVEIQHVTPQQVHFCDSETGVTTRSINVHTETGKQILLERALQTGFVDDVRHQISESDVHDVRHATDTIHDPAETPSVTV
ncbi:MAG: hypothetical protein ACR2NU_07585 [Aeoliella sp.]